MFNFTEIKIRFTFKWLNDEVLEVTHTFLTEAEVEEYISDVSRRIISYERI